MNLLWSIDEPYVQVVRRAHELADAQGSVVAIVDAVSGRVVRRITPVRGYFA